MHEVIRCRPEFQRGFSSQKVDEFYAFHAFAKSLVFNEEVA